MAIILSLLLVHNSGCAQTEYVRDLLKDSDYPKFDLDLCCKMFKEWKSDKKASITGYRDRVRPDDV